MKVAIIVAYFGSFPNYFQLFLDSCGYNKDFEWIIFSDDKRSFDYPINVNLIDMTFPSCKQLIQSKFDFEISLNTPQKLCDYKCAYGYIFSEYLEEYDWWGHCDLDQIFGDLSHFITDEMLEKYDKLFSLGHLTLYRNNDENNSVFRNALNGCDRYKEVFTTDTGCAFDEWLPGNVNEIFIQSGIPIMLKNIGADIHSYRTVLTTVDFDVKHRKYIQSSIDNSIFMFDKGKLYQIYQSKGKVCRTEYAYVHLQKRKMKDKRGNNSRRYYIIPNQFISCISTPEIILKRCKKYKVFNYQYFIVKYKSFKYRLKSGNWNFTSVFKQS